MIMESILSFLPYFFSIIFLVKAKTSKYISFSVILSQNSFGQSIRLQDFKLNISRTKWWHCLLFYMLIPNQELIEKYWGRCHSMHWGIKKKQTNSLFLAKLTLNLQTFQAPPLLGNPPPPPPSVSFFCNLPPKSLLF